MSKQRTAKKNHTRISYVHRGVGSVVLRRFDAACDSFDELTQMLHRSFARLGRMGLNCTCIDQSALITRARAMRGDCYVAVCNGRLVGTMTLYAQDGESSCALYRRNDVASVRQFGVDPAYQSRGIGKSLLAYADHWAAIRGYAELALDTPQPAAHLIAFTVARASGSTTSSGSRASSTTARFCANRPSLSATLPRGRAVLNFRKRALLARHDKQAALMPQVRPASNLASKPALQPALRPIAI